MGVKIEDADIIRIDAIGKKKIYTFRCKKCGAVMQGGGQVLRAYCPECQKYVRRQKEKERGKTAATRKRKGGHRIGVRKTIKPKISIEEINAAARAAGMSYGAWVALHEQL